MTAQRLVRSHLWTILLAMLVGALVSLFVAVQRGEAVQAVEDQVIDQHHQGKIIGGTAVPDGKYKFITALLDKTRPGTTFDKQFCSGTLIDNNGVLTAAHCVDGTSASSLQVTVGRTVLDSDQGQVRNVSRIFIHPSWNSNTFAYDAAVLKLSSPVSGIAPIKLATSSQNFLETPGRNATVAGWGNTIAQPADGPSPGSSFPQRMREAQVPIVSDAKAESIYDAIYGPSGYIPPIQVAAGKDTCQGDSGGPMFAKASGKFTQIGITSCVWHGHALVAGCSSADLLLA